MVKKFKKEKLLKKPTSMKELALGMITYNAFSILGPLIVFLIIGFVLDYIFNTKPIMLISGVVVAFIVTNILTFIKIKKLIGDFHKIYPVEKENDKNIDNEQKLEKINNKDNT